MHAWLATTAVLLLSSVLATGAAAQDTAAVPIGARLRVRTTPGTPWAYGQFRGVFADSLTLTTAHDTTARRYPLRSLAAIEVYQRNERQRSSHALKGVIVGAIASVVVLYAAVRHCEATDRHSEGPPCAIGYAGLPIVLVEGAGIGGIVGAAWPVRHWRPVRFIERLAPTSGTA